MRLYVAFIWFSALCETTITQSILELILSEDFTQTWKSGACLWFLGTVLPVSRFLWEKHFSSVTGSKQDGEKRVWPSTTRERDSDLTSRAAHSSVSVSVSNCFVKTINTVLFIMCFCMSLQYWTDFYLQWNMSDYPGVTSVRFPDSQIWRPDILLYNRYCSTFLPVEM